MHKHKNIVSYIILALIGVLTTASILNITAKAHSYHSGFSANLIGIAFGLALAVTVYVVMVADTPKTRWTAVGIAVVFAAASATIQTALYLDEMAPLEVALSFGVLVPFSEAGLAVIEALLRREVVMEAEQGQIGELAQKLAASLEAQTAAANELAHTRQQLDETGRQLAAAKNELASRQQAASQPAKPRRQPAVSGTASGAATLTANQIAKIQDVVAAAQNGFAVDTELIDMVDWIGSETSARRYRGLAEQHGYIHRNGDGRYHPGEAA
jgi:Skp family chaperone for outer membrane proteins